MQQEHRKHWVEITITFKSSGDQQKFHENHDIVIHLQGRFLENRDNPSNICLEPSIQEALVKCYCNNPYNNLTRFGKYFYKKKRTRDLEAQKHVQSQKARKDWAQNPSLSDFSFQFTICFCFFLLNFQLLSYYFSDFWERHTDVPSTVFVIYYVLNRLSFKNILK